MRKRVFTRSFWAYMSMMLVGLVVLVMFNIVPLTGIVMAFENFKPKLGIFQSPWVGLKNFEYMFSLSDTGLIVRNTFMIAIKKIIGNLIIPLIFALLLNEVRCKRFKTATQTIVYLPHFLSWVILASVLLDVFGYYRTLLHRQEMLQKELGKKQVVHPTLISTFGLRQNEYSGFFAQVISLDDLMRIGL